MSTDEQQRNNIEAGTTEEFRAPENWGEAVEVPDYARRYRTLWRRIGALALVLGNTWLLTLLRR